MGRKHLFKRENDVMEVHFDMGEFINSVGQTYENLTNMPLKEASSQRVSSQSAKGVSEENWRHWPANPHESVVGKSASQTLRDQSDRRSDAKSHKMRQRTKRTATACETGLPADEGLRLV